MTNHNTINYNFLRQNQIIPIRTRTTCFYNSLFPTTIRDWNNLPLVVSSAISVTCFKNALNKTDEVNTSKIPYSLGHSYEETLHTRLRLGLCVLNKHLYNYNLCLSKCCDHCDGNKIEDAEHYLLKCSRYTTPRITLLLNVKHIICPDINITLLRDLCPTYLTNSYCGK